MPYQIFQEFFSFQDGKLLNDVIAWLDKTVGCWSCIVGQHTYIRELMVYWDLLKPFLKDQDQELIDWLAAVGE